jgi:hypothetical protein
MSSNHLQMTYLPYISMGSQVEIQIGKVKIWNYSMKSEEYITDANVRNHIDKILKLNVHRGKPISGIGMATIGNIDFRLLSEREKRDIHESCMILFLATLSYQLDLKGDNVGFSMRTFENFNCIIQNFKPGDKFIAQFSGMIINLEDMELINNISINKPPYVMLHQPALNYDSELLKYLIILRKRKGKLYNRIVRATDTFRQSYYNNQDASWLFRILFQMASFEILFDLGQDSRKEFKERIEQYCAPANARRYIHFYTSRGKKKKDNNRTMQGKWADGYYQLRNNIVHGNVISKSQYLFRRNGFHFHLANMFFIIAIKKLINEGLGRIIFDESILWDTEEQSFSYENNRIHRLIMKGLLNEIKSAKQLATKRKFKS